MELLFNENLRLALAAKEMTQQELADKLETTQATVNRWIKGINEPNLKTFLQICNLLDETPNSLLGYDEISNSKYEFTYEHNNTKLIHKENK